MKLIYLMIFLPTFALAQMSYEVKVDKDPVAGAITLVTLKRLGLAKEPPLLYDKADIAYEKGLKNDFFSGFPRDKELTLADTKYNAKSVWSGVGGKVFIESDSAHMRYAGSGRHYYGATEDSFLENPRIHPRSGTPVESKKLYISWWFYPQTDTRDYIPFQIANISANFNPVEGDDFVVSVEKDWTGVTEVYGQVIKYDPATKELIGNFYGQSSPTKVKGRVLSLQKNGATALLEVETGWRGSNKFIRIWESDGSEGTFRLSWTNTTIALHDTQTYKASNVIAREWNHMEIFIDQTKHLIKTKVNGLSDQEVIYKTIADAPGHSPTIGLIGFDASVPIAQKFWMDDIYMDNSFRRITLASAPKYEDVTHEEVQFFQSWTENEIKFTPNYGSLNRKVPAYIYIYDENGVPNQEGVKFESPVLME